MHDYIIYDCVKIHFLAFLHATRAFIAMSLLPQLFCLYYIWKGIQSSSGYFGYSGYKLCGGIAAGFSGIHVQVFFYSYHIKK